MEGRRVSRRAPKRNPLYVLFMGLCAAVLVLLIAVIILSLRLRAANKALEQYQNPTQQVDPSTADDPAQKPDGSLEGDDTPAIDPAGPVDSEPSDEPGTQSGETKVGWLDLTGHSEVSVAPQSVFDQYYTYYTTNGVNLRGGPDTSYARVKLLDLGTQVKAAAKDGAWTFVSVDGKFGWVSSDYLSTTKPEIKQETAPTQQSGAAQTGADASSQDNTPPEWLT